MSYQPRRDPIDLRDVPMADDPEAVYIENQGLPSALLRWFYYAVAFALLSIIVVELRAGNTEPLMVTMMTVFLGVGWLVRDEH